MIEGFKIDVTSQELEEVCKARQVHHEERAAFYRSQVDSLRAGGVRPTAVSNDPTTSLEHSWQEHSKRAAFFRFLKEHIIPFETYRLTEHDLTRLEILDRYL